MFYWPDDDSPHMERKTEAYPVPWRTLVKLSKPDWWLLLLGMIGFILVGVLLSAIYVLFSNAVKVTVIGKLFHNSLLGLHRNEQNYIIRGSS